MNIFSKRPLIEVISTSPFDSKIINDIGANRIELVSALEIGGLTPSSAIIRKCLEVADIPTMVMVRHHNQGFILNSQQIELFNQQILQLKDRGVKGMVIGGVTKENKIDEKLLQKISDSINLNKILLTFHKASDQTSNLVQTYETLNKYHIPRVLTQGGKFPILQNKQILKKLIKENKIATLLGGGISQVNVKQIIQELNPLQIHIGTCVRKNKFGDVDSKLLSQFIQLVQFQS